MPKSPVFFCSPIRFGSFVSPIIVSNDCERKKHYYNVPSAASVVSVCTPLPQLFTSVFSLFFLTLEKDILFTSVSSHALSEFNYPFHPVSPTPSFRKTIFCSGKETKGLWVLEHSRQLWRKKGIGTFHLMDLNGSRHCSKSQLFSIFFPSLFVWKVCYLITHPR